MQAAGAEQRDKFATTFPAREDLVTRKEPGPDPANVTLKVLVAAYRTSLL